MPKARARALVALGAALQAGEPSLDRAAPRDDVRRALLGLPGIGAWTADSIAMRALGAPDILLQTDVCVRNAPAGRDPTRVVYGTRVVVRVDLGGPRSIKTTTKT